MLVAIFAVLISIFSFHHFYWKRKNYPPGPIPLPFIGNLHTIASNPPGYAAFEKWRKEFGDVYTYWIYGKPIIAVNDFETIQETFVKDGDTFAGRADWGFHMEYLRGGSYGISLIDGEPWVEHRKFIIQVFRNLGMGRKLMEEKIQSELRIFFKEVQNSLNGKCQGEVDIMPLIERTIANAINQMLFGFSFHSEEEIKVYGILKNCLVEFQSMIMWPSIVFGLSYPNFVPKLPYFSGNMKKFKDSYETMITHFSSWIQNSKSKPSSDPETYVEAYLQEAATSESPYFTETYLKNILFDLWIAGQETTSNNCVFSILYLLHNPEIQKKLHEELDTVIGSKKEIQIADRSKLVYVNAFINEVQRSINLLPQNMFHRTMRDNVVGGYFVEKGTTIIPQISAVLYDEKIFPEPHKFKPERFIDENGGLKKVEELIPFSIGKRQCPGEALARTQLFLFIANFYNQFQMMPIDPDNLPSLDKIPAISIQPTPFKCIIKKRY